MLQVEVSEIVVGEADEPDAVVDFLDSETLACEHAGDVDLLAMQADASAGGDQDVAVVERIGQFGQAVIAARCRLSGSNSTGLRDDGPKNFGGPERTRTSDLRFRKPLLYPAELRDRS